MVVLSEEYPEGSIRILARGKIRPDPRVKVLGIDNMGFTHVMADLVEGEGVCWRCGGIDNNSPYDPQKICPYCGENFND